MKTLYTEFAPFDKDGRHKASIDYAHVLPNTRPIMVTYHQARENIKRFLKRGWSHHSGGGSTLWVIVKFCAHKNIKIRINTYYDEVDGAVIGYEVNRL